jgi:hypothetical protein
MKYFISIFSVSMLLLTVVVFTHLTSDASEPFYSVEFALSEMSPNGLAGGLAMPASGASVPGGRNATCQLNGSQVRLSWSAAGDIYGHNHGAIRYVLKLDNQNNGWNGLWTNTTQREIRDEMDANCDNSSPLNPGDYCTDTTDLSQTFNIVPSTNHRWMIKACSGGNCGSWSAIGTFNCTYIPMPNLASQNLSYTGNLNSGQTINLTAGVINNGDLPTGTGFTNRFTYRWGANSSTTLSSPVRGSELTAGSQFTDTSSALLLNQTGSLHIQHCVDVLGDVTESSEVDNCTFRRLNVLAPLPTANLEVQNVTTAGAWTGNDIDIAGGDQISLRWSSTNANLGCSGTHFTATGNAQSGTQNAVTEPTSGNYITYRVRCVGDGGVASDLLKVDKPDVPPMVYSQKPIVVSGEEVTIEWNTGSHDPLYCKVNGPEINIDPLVSGSGNQSFNILNEQKYTIICDETAIGFGITSDEVIIKVLPRIQET